MEDIKKAVKENINLLNLSLEHPPTKKKLMLGRSIACEFPDAYDVIRDVNIIDWFIECREDMIKNLSREELDWVLEQTHNFMVFLWKKEEMG